jgi:NAD(P)-dependent dehydrogenase (short-subunit alcohol dehydrogenase family)
MVRKKLQGQVAIVTGASRGIGLAAAELLAQAGAAVVLTGRDDAQVEATASRMREQGARAIGVAGDVSDPGHAEVVVESALDQFERVDILVNNAAVVWPLEVAAESDPDEWAYAIHVNLIGPYYMARNLLPLMLVQKYGRIVNLSSGAAVKPIAGMSAYCVSKAGLDMLTRGISVETAGLGITVNSLYPGMVDTDMQADIRSVDTTGSPLDFGRWHEVFEADELSSATEAAKLIYWLVGPWSRERSGEIFSSADKGWTAQVQADLVK